VRGAVCIAAIGEIGQAAARHLRSRLLIAFSSIETAANLVCPRDLQR
jgi:hypothetical protein